MMTQAVTDTAIATEKSWDQISPDRRVPGVGVILAGIWLVIMVMLAVVADLLPIADPLQSDFGANRSGPGVEHLLGADHLGRDILARVIYGGRISLVVGIGATLLAAVVGGTAGVLAGYFRGRLEALVTVIVDVMLAFPALVLAITLTAFMGASLQNVILAIGVLAIPAFMRLARAEVLVIRERKFVTSARTLGARHGRIVFLEVVPNVVPPLLAYSLVIVAVAIVVEGALSFLGLGVPGPTPTWGGMISGGMDELSAHPHMSLIPAGVMFVTVLALNVVAEELQGRVQGRHR